MATPKKPTVKITGKASTSGGRAADRPSITRRGSIAQSPKITGGKTAAKKPSLASQATKAAGKVAGRAKTVAREVRDIPTAVASIAASSNTRRLKKTSANFVKQVKEVGTAATTGKKGTSSDLTQKNMSSSKSYTYRQGTKRK